MPAPLLAILTGATCGDACWHAREEVCRCSCGGANHGILRGPNGERPTRTCKIGGNFYELAAVVAAQTPWELNKADSEAYAEVAAERFPGLWQYGYGEYSKWGNFSPVLSRKISETQARWPEVAAIPGARRLIWARPAGTPYCTREQA